MPRRRGYMMQIHSFSIPNEPSNARRGRPECRRKLKCAKLAYIAAECWNDAAGTTDLQTLVGEYIIRSWQWRTMRSQQFAICAVITAPRDLVPFQCGAASMGVAVPWVETQC